MPRPESPNSLRVPRRERRRGGREAEGARELSVTRACLKCQIEPRALIIASEAMAEGHAYEFTSEEAWANGERGPRFTDPKQADERRKALKANGKFGLYPAPTMLALLKSGRAHASIPLGSS